MIFFQDVGLKILEEEQKEFLKGNGNSWKLNITKDTSFYHAVKTLAPFERDALKDTQTHLFQPTQSSLRTVGLWQKKPQPEAPRESVNLDQDHKPSPTNPHK